MQYGALARGLFSVWRNAGLPWGPTGFDTGSLDREDDHHGEKGNGEEKGGNEKGGSGTQKEDNKSCGQEADEENDEKGGAKAQGAGEKARVDPRGGADLDVAVIVDGLGYERRRRQLKSIGSTRDRGGERPPLRLG